MKLGFCLVLVGLATACGDDSNNGPDPAVDAPSCDVLWTRVTANGATATGTVAGGLLTLSAPSLADNADLSFYQQGLTGDFNAVFTYQAFSAGGTGAFVQAVVSEVAATPDQLVTAAVGTYPVNGVSAGFQRVGMATDVDIQAGTTDGAGTFTFLRSGDQVTVTATNGVTSATRTQAYDLAPLRIGIQLGSNNGAIAATSSIEITGFTVTGGGGTVKGDSFACDSLAP